LSACISVLEDRYLKCFDRIYGVKTNGYISLASMSVAPSKLANANCYAPVNAWALRKLLKKIALPKTYHFADLGCGLGRPGILAAEYGFAKVTGVEFTPELCAKARENIARCRLSACRIVPITIVQGDVLDYCEQTDDDVFFMFRPFSWDFQQIIASKLADRASVLDKCLTIIYSERMNLPESFAKAFSGDSRFRSTGEFTTLGQRFCIYQCGPQGV
jgi:SAM-dependent methyltransferase